MMDGPAGAGEREGTNCDKEREKKRVTKKETCQAKQWGEAEVENLMKGFRIGAKKKGSGTFQDMLCFNSHLRFLEFRKHGGVIDPYVNLI